MALEVSSKSKAAAVPAVPVPPPSPPPMDSWARGGRRSKRRAGGGGGSPSASASSGGESSEEDEYLAICLVMLARGVREEDEEHGGGGGATKAAGRAAAAAAAAGKAAKGYGCSVCGKVYPSYQALGGHKTSHRKPPTPAPQAVGATAAATGDEAPAGGVAEEKVHRCSLCLRTFPSGQALGGHKRLHYEGGAAAAAAAAAAEGAKKVDDKDAMKPKAAATAVLRDFDLNLPVEEEAAEIASPEAKRARIMMAV
ncbi:hypothetical protein ACP4OV_019012 [Aristida adscensionis]